METSAVEWPLAQFQLEKANQEGTRKLLATINNAAADSKLNAGRLDDAFDMWWPRLQERLTAIKPLPDQSAKRSDRALIEDILDEICWLTRITRGQKEQEQLDRVKEILAEGVLNRKYPGLGLSELLQKDIDTDVVVNVNRFSSPQITKLFTPDATEIEKTTKDKTKEIANHPALWFVQAPWILR